MELTEAQKWLEREIAIADKWIRNMEYHGNALSKTTWEIRKKALQDCQHAVAQVVNEFHRIVETALAPLKKESRVKPLTKKQHAEIAKKRARIRAYLQKHSFIIGKYSHEHGD